MKRVEVLLPVALDRSFTYAVPDDIEAEPGDIVEVPLGGRDQAGVVWGPGDPDVPAKKLKAVSGVYDLPRLTPDLLKFVDWVARYTLAPAGMVLRIALRGARGSGEESPRRMIVATGDEPARMTEARARVLTAATDRAPRTKADLARAANVSVGVIDGLVRDGALRVIEIAPEPVGSDMDADFAPPKLNGDQGATAKALSDAVHTNGFSAHLLEGVTGAGKTEVYLEAAAEALRMGKQALILLPEIALTKSVIDRVTARFGTPPGEWHSTVGTKRRARVWEGAASGDTQIVVGARSALFLPFRDLGVIIVDEEHDGGFKQEDTPVYHARDMAVVRAQISEIPVILVSATPSIESRVNAEAGRYIHHILPERFGGRTLPDIELVDLRKDIPPRGRWISPALETAVRGTLERGEQALLFLNRRGYAPVVLCRACGHRLTAPDTDSWLVEHRYTGRLVCHLTGFSMPRPKLCPSCGAEDSLVSVGPGVERVEEEVRQLFPEARVAPRTARETVSSNGRFEWRP